MNTVFTLAFFVLMPVFLTRSQDEQPLDPITSLDVAAKDSVFADASHGKPLILRSQDKAAEYFAEEQLAKLTELVDFSQQFVLVFAWRGSGQDKLSYAVMESYPEQIAFSYQPGRTRDLRPHVQIFALRANVKWSVRGNQEESTEQEVEEAATAHYLNDDGQLRFPLTLRDSQSGFAGQTGFLWTIEPDGSWKRQSFLNDTVRDADQEGELTAEQLKKLAEVLAKADLVGLPKSMGMVGVNPHIVTLTYGKKESSLVLHAGQPLPGEEEELTADPEVRFPFIVSKLQAMLTQE